MAEKPLFSDLVAWFTNQGNFASVLVKVITRHGGRVEQTLTPAVTHILCMPKEEWAKLVDALPVGRTLESYEIVKRDYISESVRYRALQDPNAFRPHLTTPPAAPAAEEACLPVSPPQSKRQKTEEMPTPPSRPSSAPTDGENPALLEENGAPDEPCVVERRGSEWVAVRGRLPRFTGGGTDLPWGSFGVWEERYDPAAARRTVDTLRDFWYHTQTASSRPGSAEGQQPASGGAARLNGICTHGACSRLNRCIVAALEEVRATYSPGKKDHFKIKQLDRAQQSVAAHPAPLRRPEDVDDVAGLVAKSASRVKEIIEVGRVASKVDAVETDERALAIARLQRVWGAGAVVAEEWHKKGCRDVEDVCKAAEMGIIKLTMQQRCGVTHFEDLEKKNPRPAVAAVEREVRRVVFEAVELQMPGDMSDAERTYCFATGSYRRGALESSDIDILIVLPPSAAGTDCYEFLHAILGTLVDRGVVLDELDPRGEAKGRHHSFADHASWMGVCRPPGVDYVARIDVKVYSPHHLVFAVNYFANSMEFCRATRHWASGSPAPQKEAQKLAPAATGFKISDQVMVPRAFREGAGGKREEVVLGPSLELKNESELFERLGLSYVPVTMRFFHAGYGPAVV